MSEAKNISTKNNKAENVNYNRKSVDSIKRFIILFLLVMFILPMLFCVYLMIRMGKLEDKIDTLTALISDRQTTVEELEDTYKAEQEEALEYLDMEAYDDIEIDASYNELLADTSEASGSSISMNGKKVYLTFDDGPGENTGIILDTLKKYNVKATFFVCYNDDASTWHYYNRIVDEGHCIAMHSYSHVYDEIYADKEAFINDVSMIHEFIYDQTGVDCKYYRFPGGSSNTVTNVDIQTLIGYLEGEDITYYDWNALSGDASYEALSPEELNSNILKYVHSNAGDSMVLMHDLTDIPETAYALEQLIITLKEEGYELCPIDESTVPVQHVKYIGDLGYDSGINTAD